MVLSVSSLTRKSIRLQHQRQSLEQGKGLLRFLLEQNRKNRYPLCLRIVEMGVKGGVKRGVKVDVCPVRGDTEGGDDGNGPEVLKYAI